ncbi:ankyrin repeat domain-containing protein [Methylocapsa sp. D3K7]|uniref:ankyrin repeat domain-containing protein n=1 Tax=Methylocapsa sp. D3K7 TaxID=3041435 RepID=UPI00244E61EA|nr:ankyrin repeat domain-containing protein [Methylocapsa sp. D3K7]WGJ13873.1 ankyrin repeat domain-containing protein [Methylocapsa sp. D3K7]
MAFISDEEFVNRINDAASSLNPDRERECTYLLLDLSYRGLTDYVHRLLEYWFDINAPDEETGMTALHIAVGRNNLELTRLLVQRGASFIPDKQGRMPSTIAAECEVTEDLCDFIAEAEAAAEARAGGV